MMKAIYTGVGLFVILGIGAIGYLALGLGGASLGGAGFELVAAFDDATGVKPGNRVEVSGVRIGEVTKVLWNAEQETAMVHFRLDGNDWKIHNDTIVSVRAAGLIGETFLSMKMGSSGELLPEGGTLYETEPAVNLTEMITKIAFGSIE